MTLTIELSWWAVPAFVTLVSMGWAFLTKPEVTGGYFGSMDLMPAVRFVAAIVISLASWLIWALLN